jgi:tetratricopeptide (TPR) repeat protein
VLIGACLIEQTQAEIEPAAHHCAAGLAMARTLDDRPTIGRALLLLGNLEMMQKNFDRARSLHTEALTVFQDIGDRAWEALALLDLGMDCQRQGDLAQAAHFADASLAINQAIGNRWDVLPTLRLLADIACARGDLEPAETLLRESLALARRERSDREAADSLSGLGVVAVAAGDWERAARCLGAAEDLYHHFAIRFPPPQRPDWAEALAAVHNALPPEQRARHWAATSPEAIIGELLDHGAAHG